MAPQAIVTNRYGKILLSVKYNPCVVNSGIVYAGFNINAPVINMAISNSNAPKIGYILPIIWSTGNTVAIKKYRNIIVIQKIIGILVKLLSKSAAPVAKVAETRIPVITMRTAIIFCILVPKYFEMMFGIVNPSFLKDMNPEKKSWTPPMKIVPNTIHKKATGPNNAPCIAPNIGPKPAIFKKWTRKFLTLDIGI